MTWNLFSLPRDLRAASLKVCQDLDTHWIYHIRTLVSMRRKTEKLLMATTRLALSDHCSDVHVQGCKQGRSPMADVVMAVPVGAGPARHDPVRQPSQAKVLVKRLHYLAAITLLRPIPLQIALVMSTTAQVKTMCSR